MVYTCLLHFRTIVKTLGSTLFFEATTASSSNGAELLEIINFLQSVSIGLASLGMGLFFHIACAFAMSGSRHDILYSL